MIVLCLCVFLYYFDSDKHFAKSSVITKSIIEIIILFLHQIFKISYILYLFRKLLFQIDLYK